MLFTISVQSITGSRTWKAGIPTNLPTSSQLLYHFVNKLTLNSEDCWGQSSANSSWIWSNVYLVSAGLYCIDTSSSSMLLNVKCEYVSVVFKLKSNSSSFSIVMTFWSSIWARFHGFWHNTWTLLVCQIVILKITIKTHVLFLISLAKCYLFDCIYIF